MIANEQMANAVFTNGSLTFAALSMRKHSTKN